MHWQKSDWLFSRSYKVDLKIVKRLLQKIKLLDLYRILNTYTYLLLLILLIIKKYFILIKKLAKSVLYLCQKLNFC